MKRVLNYLLTGCALFAAFACKVGIQESAVNAADGRTEQRVHCIAQVEMLQKPEPSREDSTFHSFQAWEANRRDARQAISIDIDGLTRKIEREGSTVTVGQVSFACRDVSFVVEPW